MISHTWNCIFIKSSNVTSGFASISTTGSSSASAGALADQKKSLQPDGHKRNGGAAVPVTGWNSDQDLTYNVEERCWEIKDIELNAGECKFRANDDWAMQ